MSLDNHLDLLSPPTGNAPLSSFRRGDQGVRSCGREMEKILSSAKTYPDNANYYLILYYCSQHNYINIVFFPHRIHDFPRIYTSAKWFSVYKRLSKSGERLWELPLDWVWCEKATGVSASLWQSVVFAGSSFICSLDNTRELTVNMHHE